MKGITLVFWWQAMKIQCSLYLEFYSVWFTNPLNLQRGHTSREAICMKSFRLTSNNVLYSWQKIFSWMRDPWIEAILSSFLCDNTWWSVITILCETTWFTEGFTSLDTYTQINNSNFFCFLIEFCSLSSNTARNSRQLEILTSFGLIQEAYRKQLETMLLQYALPAFSSPYGHLRAKACWLSGQFADIDFREGCGHGATFQALFSHTVKALTDSDIPVCSLMSLLSSSSISLSSSLPFFSISIS